jgi:hypothetical protein
MLVQYYKLTERGVLRYLQSGLKSDAYIQGTHKMIHNIVQMSAEAQTASTTSLPTHSTMLTCRKLVNTRQHA